MTHILVDIRTHVHMHKYIECNTLKYTVNIFLFLAVVCSLLQDQPVDFTLTHPNQYFIESRKIRSPQVSIQYEEPPP